MSRLLVVLGVVRRRIDVFRVREHLRRTEDALRASSPDGLDPAQRRRRREALDALADYRRRGAVPTSTETAQRVPQFVGANGVPCAVAALLLADGERQFVERVAATDNAVRIETVTDGPLLEWLDENGLTQAEAARIQPSYGASVVSVVTDCGPVSCAVARVFAGTVAVAVAAVAEFVGYRLLSGLFPDNPFKRFGWLAYITAMNLLAAPLVGVTLYALFP